MTAFGLEIESDTALPFLEGALATPTGRSVHISSKASEAPIWPPGSRLISDERYADGSVCFQIESAETGYRIHGPAYGASVISIEGDRIWGSPGDGGLDEWQRLLVAQVLPFAAVLQGLEVLHAGGVAIDGRGVALSGPSGSGKTSVALALRRLGAEMLADDVVAVERMGKVLLAHPGAPMAGIDKGEAERLRITESREAGPVLAVNSRERVMHVTVASEPVPLAALIMLDRRRDFAGAPKFEPVCDPRLLLASTFNFVVVAPERLGGLLEVCAQLARGQVERLTFGADTDPDRLAAAIWMRLAG